MKKFFLTLLIIVEILLLVLVGLFIFHDEFRESLLPTASRIPEQTTPVTTVPTTEPATEPTTIPTTQPIQTEPPTTEPPATEPVLEPFFVEDTDPSNWNVKWEVIVDGSVVENYTREEEIYFDGGDYFALPGVASFRGGNYRTDGSYGTLDITECNIQQIWSKSVGNVAGPGWGGCGWTGQPLVVQWDAETRAIMNLYEDKKQKEDLVEVIYAKMDGYVHFIDMEDGSYTRDPLFVGMAFKGSGAIDPRGYPLLYLGSGLQQGSKSQTIFVISLIDGTILYERSGYDRMLLRAWCAFDGTPLLDAETDTLIWAGESGLLYTIKLNTQYDKAAGTIAVEPDAPVMTRYTDDYHRRGRYLGYESSVTAAQNYLFLGDNAGMVQCVDANTMELIWVQDLKDDINATPVFEWGSDGKGYLYLATSMDYTSGDMPLCKLDAQTGEIVWAHYMDCTTVTDVPGGVLSSPMLGREGTNMENLIIFSVGRSPSAWAGQVVALDKETGEVVWQYETENYMWSSPIGLYTEEGKGFIFQADASGNCYLMDGATGEVLETVYLGSTVEASPVAFGDRVLLGTRDGMCLFKIS